MTPDEVAKHIGQQVYDNFDKDGCLICPVCLEPGCPKQPLSSMGDFREVLFCPHCDLTVELKVTL